MYLSTDGLEKVVRNGDQVYFEGGVRCMVVDVEESCFTIWAKNDGIIQCRESVKLPEKHSWLPIIKAEDVTDLEYLSQMHRIDYISVPFVENKEDLAEVRKMIPFLDSAVIISRIDDKLGLEDFWNIANNSGAIIFNRSGLAISYNADKLFQLNRFFIEQCNILATPMIIETEVMESMDDWSFPSRKEVADL